MKVALRHTGLRMSPEQAIVRANAADRRSDVDSLGAIRRECGVWLLPRGETGVCCNSTCPRGDSGGTQE